jgi:predicted transposase YdaD
MSEEMGVKYMQKWEERVYDKLEGKIEGENICLVEMIRKKHLKGKSLAQIADEVEEVPEEIQKYYEAVCEFPEKNAEEIVEMFMENEDEVD